MFNRLRNNRARLEGKPINPFGLGSTIPSKDLTANNNAANVVNVGGGSSTSSSSASQGTTNLSGSHSLSTGGSSMMTTSILNGAPVQQQQHYSILIHYSLSDKTFVYDTLAPKMISDLTPSEETLATLLLQKEKKRQICFQQQQQANGTKSNDNDGKCIEKNLMNSESVIVVASEHYIKTNNNNNELKTITEKVCCNGGSNKKPLVVIALDSSIAQMLRHNITSLKPSNILVWGSPNFWQNVSRNLMTKYQTFNNNKLHNLSSLSSPNKKKLIGGSDEDDDDEIWTYLKTNSENLSRKNNDFSSNNTNNRLSMGTLKENLNNMRNGGHQNNTQEDQSYSFNFPSSTLQLGKRKQYLRGNPIPSSTPTSRRISQPDSTSSMSRPKNTSKVENQHSLCHTKNVLENPFESRNRFDRFAHRKPPPYPTTTQGMNSNSDSDYMSVNDSLAVAVFPRNEPIYHTLDDEQHESFKQTVNHDDNSCEDQKVYINSALEVVYPTASLLRKQQQKLLELQRQHQYLKQKQRHYHGNPLADEVADDENVDEEFDELLGENLEEGYTDDDKEDVYENGDDNSANYYRHDVERKTSNYYVPSPAPGSYPRNRSLNNATTNNVETGFVAMRDQYDLGGNNVAGRRVVYNNHKGSKNGRSKGSYFV